MSPEQIVELVRQTLAVALWVAGPVLLFATLVSLVISIMQVVTSIQEITISTVPRLASVVVGIFVLMPWMLRKMVSFTMMLFSDFSPYVH